MKIFKSALLMSVLALPVFAMACPDGDGGDDGDTVHMGKGHKKVQSSLAKVTVEEAAKLNKDGKAIMVDANGESTRKSIGYVPGARLLTNYKTYDEKELKASKKDTLVFYCGSEKCSAAPKAAEVASAKGYNVKVMDGGIKGWVKAGYKTAKL